MAHFSRVLPMSMAKNVMRRIIRTFAGDGSDEVTFMTCLQEIVKKLALLQSFTAPWQFHVKVSRFHSFHSL
nr:hypothetical protein [Comamonas testosteroni]